ncbi:RNA-binding protein NOB1 [Kwoniella heveanensis CBS 569]|uniref:20S-pre-rRNA D-site endonuclease NOB1 n=1 Tax=Kwoniella heveanensis BCC8398 TaxID=1296120 RepID=A0A1B9GUV7_9TREE|nr:RNA-binding protein NOB1 [Kwoniella heveanensis BCC8398]OCF42165.1 RNA-binding protein NOB1 [Kwoniella heveanensis CBS 569]
MAKSWSAIAKPASGQPEVISIATPKSGPSSSSTQADNKQEVGSTAGPSQRPQQPATARPFSEPETTEAVQVASSSSAPSSSATTIQHLILDAGPLLSLTPLRHLATSFHTTPLVFAELRDPKAREHWERLGLAGVDVRVEPPSAEAMARVTEFAKKTGDFAVLSQTDLSVAALTYQYEAALNGVEGIRTEPGQRIKKKSTQENAPQQPSEEVDGEVETQAQEEMNAVDVEEVTRSIDQVLLDGASQASDPDPTSATDEVDAAPSHSETLQKSPAEGPQSHLPPDIDNESDGGEWITPSNLTTHRSRDLGLITPNGSNQAEPPAVACMTGDFAVQNILLGMGLGLVGEGGKKITKVKSFVLRCHACFKICKDSSKRFCPSCGNATLLRTTVSTDSKTGQQSVHLKKNFQYHTRGTKYSIPDPKMGRAKGQQKGGSGLILREDQMEWSDAVRHQDRQRVKEEKRAAKGALEGWNDPDWLPEIITVGMSGKGRSGGQGMPTIGHGRKNPNQARRKR